jgi:hypothetical protein
MYAPMRQARGSFIKNLVTDKMWNEYMALKSPQSLIMVMSEIIVSIDGVEVVSMILAVNANTHPILNVLSVISSLSSS